MWKAVKGILPAATVAKVRIYKKGQNYLDDMQEFVALDQVRVGDATERMERTMNIGHAPLLCQNTTRMSSVPRVEIHIQLTPLRLSNVRRLSVSRRTPLLQIPQFLGGTCPQPWPYGEGGDIPKGEGAALESGESPVGGEPWADAP